MESVKELYNFIQRKRLTQLRIVSGDYCLETNMEAYFESDSLILVYDGEYESKIKLENKILEETEASTCLIREEESRLMIEFKDKKTKRSHLFVME